MHEPLIYYPILKEQLLDDIQTDHWPVCDPMYSLCNKLTHFTITTYTMRCTLSRDTNIMVAFIIRSDTLYVLEQPRTCPEAAGPSGHTLPFTIHRQLGVMLSACRHRYQRKRVPSVTWRREDSRRFVVTVTDADADLLCMQTPSWMNTSPGCRLPWMQSRLDADPLVM